MFVLSNPPHRTILYQRVRARDPSRTNTRIYLGTGIERGSSLFMWISLDQVSRDHLDLGEAEPGVNGSIIPCLALRGVASAIARSGTLRAKVLFCELSATI
jgi:hypothetical protein